MLEWVLLLIAFGVVVAAAVYVAGFARRRRRRLARIARDKGFGYERESAMLTDEWLRRFALFNTGTHRRAANVLTGQYRGISTVCFDLHYRDHRPRMQTVMAFRLSRSKLPRFALLPHKTLLPFEPTMVNGEQPTALPHDSDAFKRNYELLGCCEESLANLFTSRVVKFFEVSGHWAVEGAGEWMLVYRPDILPAPAHLFDNLREAMHVVRIFRVR